MYDAFRENNIGAQNITVLYGSGNIEDTGISSFKPAPLIMPTLEFDKPSLYPPKKPSLFQGFGNNDSASEASTPIKKSDFTLADLFRGETKVLDGEAKKEKIQEKLQELKKKMKPGDDLTLYITDHGDLNETTDESLVNLWGEKITTTELGELLKEIPETNNIRIITNICHGGGLNDLTKKNICVFANQEKKSPSYSESKDLDLYGQNFAFALKNKLDFDNDGIATYLDAHEYSISLENKKNLAVTSLDWFLLKTRDKIQLLKQEKESPIAPYCEISSDESLQGLSDLIEDFSYFKKALQIDEDVPASRQHLLSTRLLRKLSALKKNEAFSKNETLEIKLAILKKNLEEAASKWDAQTFEQKAYQRKRFNLEAQQLKKQVEELESLINSNKNASLELDLIRYGDQELLEEYENVKRCLEYAY